MFNNMFIGFPGGSDSKESACNARDPGSIPGLGRSPGEGNGNPLQYLPGEFHGQRSLVGYSLWGCKASDMTEQLHFTSHTSCVHERDPGKLNHSPRRPKPPPLNTERPKKERGRRQLHEPVRQSPVSKGMVVTHI